MLDFDKQTKENINEVTTSKTFLNGLNLIIKVLNFFKGGRSITGEFERSTAEFERSFNITSKEAQMEQLETWQIRYLAPM